MLNVKTVYARVYQNIKEIPTLVVNQNAYSTQIVRETELVLEINVETLVLVLADQKQYVKL